MKLAIYWICAALALGVGMNLIGVAILMWR
jgi:hypothetical protein